MLFNISVFKQCKSSKPVICVGNLSMGGTGKTPHVEYLVRLLSGKFDTATLSRGYKRKTRGFVLAGSSSSSRDIGDEPRQYKFKFPNLTVAVCEERCKGAQKIIELKPATEVIILDDAFQHRSLKAGLYVMLTDYNNLFTRDHVVPSGTLREFRCGARRADVIVVTKCPETLSGSERKKITEEINPADNQQVFFSYITYGSLVPLNNAEVEENIHNFDTALLFSGIANTRPLNQYLINNKYSVHTLHFSDHHQFSSQDLINIRTTFNNIAKKNSVIITTEKDAMRIDTPEQQAILKNLPVYYLPIYVEFFPSDKEMFNKIILNYVANAGKN